MAKVSAYQVAVIGGGVIGAACARAAALRQLHTLILEPGPDPAAASPASAGMLAAQIEPSDDLMLGLCVRGRDVYEHLAATLKDTTGIDIAFWRGGIAAAAFDEPQADGLREAAAAGRGGPAPGACPRLRGGLPRPPAGTPVRGQMAATPWPGETPPAILYYDHGYVLTRGAEAVLGSTMEHAGFDCRVTNEGLAQIFRCAVRLLPAVARLPVLRTWAGLRPVTPDGRPIVGPDPDVRGLFYATGHGRNGVLLAALTGDTIGDLLSKGSTDLDLTPFRPNR